MRDRMREDFLNLAKNLQRYGVIVDRTDFRRDGKNFTEFVIRMDADVWNVTMIDGAVKQIMKV